MLLGFETHCAFSDASVVGNQESDLRKKSQSQASLRVQREVDKGDAEGEGDGRELERDYRCQRMKV